MHPFQQQDGGPDVILTRPDLRFLRSIGGDGNCMFRSLSYVISGSEEHHFEIRLAIVPAIKGSSFFERYILCEGRIGTRATHVIRSTDRRAYNGDII